MELFRFKDVHLLFFYLAENKQITDKTKNIFMKPECSVIK